ncbi:hypothetical protein HPC38_01925 [Pasteurellaceae bacterium HPA106]|uniref:hypothetical protein n=1 Tax=Spirabiliibacterium pneumoniae TaxID=221400 RepID=UPI001AAD7864|nr:hypothetical protein [Spirabiliibacterium pneumoniae]MBE2895635.1 hypothetical protein [Spirabiliibacterium pneumoniae]
MNKRQQLELLQLRGEILRQRFKLESRDTKQNIAEPLSYAKSLASPLIRSALISIGTRLLFGGKKWLLLPAAGAGVASFFFLKNKQQDDNK